VSECKPIYQGCCIIGNECLGCGHKEYYPSKDLGLFKHDYITEGKCTCEPKPAPQLFSNPEIIMKPSVEKCDTITISRKVAEEWLEYIGVCDIDRWSDKLKDELKLALSKGEK
jgi:hypothetical protein